MNRYQVIVGNIGTVYAGGNAREARKTFAAYIDKSHSRQGRASGESVTMLKDDAIVSDYIGWNDSQVEED